MDDHFLEGCLFFNVNAFSRQMLKLAETSFAPVKLSPAHASLMLILYENPGISPKRLGQMLQLTPSTITRFVDALARKKLVKRQSRGKTSTIFSTEKGHEIKPAIARAYREFHQNYTRILGTGNVHSLTRQISRANEAFFQSSRSDPAHDQEL